jgi:hypothetical protein
MRRTVITTAACVLAAGIAAPAAQAGTATFKGTCAITGVSTFDPPLTGTHQLIKYDFKSGAPAEGVADGTKCSGTLNGQAVSDVPVVASVAGQGDLSCSSGESTSPGSGAIVFPDGSTFPFAFTFTAIATEVDFKASYGNGAETTGHASFLHYAPPTSVFDCSPAGSGIKALGFDATTDESSTPIEGTKPDAGAPGQQPSAGQQPTSGEQKPSAAKRRKACMKKARKIKNKKRRAKAKRRCRRIK